MAGHGPAPKEPARRARRNAEPSRKELVADGELRGPALPRTVGGKAWHSRTKVWWDTWRRSAQAAEFTDTDWDFLLDTALMHHVMWSKGQWTLAAEVRLRVAKFGATPEDRARLRWDTKPPMPPAEGESTAKPAPARERYAGLRVVKPSA